MTCATLALGGTGKVRRPTASTTQRTTAALAIEEHYKPLGPTDRVPAEPVAIAVALADKLDLLTGFWAIDEKPTGSRDPFALRRAALGVIRIITENNLKFPLDVEPDLLAAADQPDDDAPFGNALGEVDEFRRFRLAGVRSKRLPQ